MAEPVAMVPMGLMEIHLGLGEQSLDLTLPVPAGPATLRGMLPAVHALSSAFIRIGLDGMAAIGQQVSCRAGCGACCRQMVPLAAAEAHALRALVDAMPPERQVVVRERFADAGRRLADADFWARFEAAAAGPQAGFVSAVQSYFLLGIACPFLEQESCSIHESRPVACREYLVTSPAERCASASGEGVDNVAHVFKVKEALVTISAAEQAMGEAASVPMIRALEWSAANPETGAEREPKEWLDALFRRLHELL